MYNLTESVSARPARRHARLHGRLSVAWDFGGSGAKSHVWRKRCRRRTVAHDFAKRYLLPYEMLPFVW
ncbi:hypothetical protein HPS57_06935 [Prevotella sp. PINT]|uniref:hypothetical protein n=1 Tax=Palleniella intestinalis TaxID=2736291 RepID=UPI0015571A4B|nr:hypothetical protein [Palleniella intestinalis]NPD81708.1 hypothetical protein [Palleniella intestinalis]